MSVGLNHKAAATATAATKETRLMNSQTWSFLLEEIQMRFFVTKVKVKAFGLEVPRSRIIVSVLKISCYFKVLVISVLVLKSR